MKLEEVLNDKTLSALGLALIALWTWAHYGRKQKGSVALVTLLRLACGLLLLFASFDKVLDPGQFSKMIKTCYDILPPALVPLAAVVIPWLELFTGACLILGFRWRGAALVFCSLMAVYSLTIVWDLFHGVDCNCGCFKMDSGEKMTWWTVLRDGVFFTAGFIVLTASRTLATLEDLFFSRPA